MTNDNETTKPILSMSSILTNITNQANVSNRIADTFGIEAGRRVWQASPDDWERVAGEYVTLTVGNHYGTEWVKDLRAQANLKGSMARHPAGKGRLLPPPVPAAKHLSLVPPPTMSKTSAMSKLLHFLGAH